MSKVVAQSPRRIRALPERLANQIAAGEVVERPASVLKELLENSLDSGAERISVDIEHGGARLIRVRDDGVGIHRQDLALALDRHATSKIASLDDLENVASLGFRGEALPSIASVSRLELSSCPAGGESGWKLAAAGRAAQASPQPVPHPQGTTVTVKDLFYNTPARRKFLRTEKTEYRHLEDVLKRAALSRFDCAFSLRHNGRESYSLPAASSDAERERRVAKLCGAAFMQQALALCFEAADLQLSGWTGGPGYSRGVSDLQYFFVNGRMVRDNLLRHAVRHAHHGIVESGRQPAYVLFLRISPAQVDVNVHPSKHEIRFRDARSVHDFIVRSLRHALSTDTELTDHQSGGAVFSPASSPAFESRDGRGRAKQAGIVPDNPLHSRHPWRSDARAAGMSSGPPSSARGGDLREHAAAYGALRTVPAQQSASGTEPSVWRRRSATVRLPRAPCWCR
jgi:DNA mismatch repair protein MutL